MLLLSAQAGLQTTLDGFKINLGLPTEVEVRIDDSTLDQFELNDERLDSMRKQTEALLVRLLQEGATAAAAAWFGARASCCRCSGNSRRSTTGWSAS